MLHPRFSRSARVSWCVLVFVMLSLVPISPAHAASSSLSDELATIHKAYTTLMINLYEQPDSGALLTAAHAAAERDLKTTLHMDALSGDSETQFSVFGSSFLSLVAQSATVSLPKGQLAHDIIRDMTKAVGDPHTYFLDEQAADAERRRLNGDTSIVNFGMVAVNIGGEYYVKQAIDNSPVKLAGLLPGDHVLALNDTPVNWDNRNSVLGNPLDGHTYALRVRHAHASEDTVLAVQMQRYSRETLTHSVLDGHIGYIRTFAFFGDIPQKFDEALDALHQQGVDSLLIDFRGNGGGTNVEDVLGRFLPDGTKIGSSEGRRERMDFVAHAPQRPMETLPIVVLMDETSGSASEISALALHELAGARLVGTKTAGAFGTARFADLGDNTLLAITTSAYISVRGAQLNKVGITPDVVVDRSMDDMLSGADPQMAAACGEVAKVIGTSAVTLLRAA